MKKFAIILLLSVFALTACDKEDDYKVREWTVASELGIAHGPQSLQPVLLIKAGDDTSWRPFYDGIDGFAYERGYEYKLRIKAEQIADPPADGPSVQYSLLEEISKTPARSIIPEQFYPIFTMEVAPKPIIHQGRQYLGVRFPEAGFIDWQPWPFHIEGFDYEQNYIYSICVKAEVIPAPNQEVGYYTVQYSLLEVLDMQPAQ